MGCRAPRLITLLVVIAAVAALAPPPAQAAASKRCYPRGSDGIATSTRVRVFVVTDPEYEARYVFYACALRSGRRFELGDGYTDTNISFGLRGVRISGLTVGFQAFGCVSGPTCGSYVATLDLRTGRRLQSPNEGERQLTDLVVSRDGAAAWIDRATQAGPARVRRLDAQGTTTLDSSPGVEPGSLALARDNRIYWTGEGRARSDSLGAPHGSERVDDAVAGHRRCFPRGSTATAATRHVRIYEVADENQDDILIYACVLRSGRRVLLSTAFMTSGIVDQPRINGYRVAFELSDCPSGASQCGSTVETLDLRTGQRRASGFPNSFVSELELAASGSVAWIESRAPTFPTYQASYRVLTRVGDREAELDSGGDIQSLALGGGARVYWTNAGVPRSAALE